MLITGVDVPICRNVVLVRVINPMTEFKQIIGRGTGVRDDGKLYFNILDYAGSATRLFADPDFDGEPALVTEEEMNESGEQTGEPQVMGNGGEPPRRKYYVDTGSVEIATHLVYELDADSKQFRVVSFTDYTAEKVRSMCPSAAALRSRWSIAEERAAIITALEERGIFLEELAEALKQAEADPFDLLCHIAYDFPLRTRRERAEALRREQKGFFDKYAPKAREVLGDILEKYIEYGMAQFQIPEILKVPPISERGTVMEIAAMFGGTENLRSAANELQTLLYAP
jgi:type I restriction enzyme R subunit